MPIPKPNPGENRDKFINRCMADRKMREDYKQAGQRAAVCYDAYKGTKK